MERRFLDLNVKDQNTNVEIETSLGSNTDNDDDDIEIVDDGGTDATDVVAAPSEHFLDESVAPSEHLTDERTTPSEKLVDKRDVDSTPCLTCGRIIQNKFLKIHYKTHKKGRTEEAEKSNADDTNIRNDESTPWEIIPAKPSEKLKTPASLKDKDNERDEGGVNDRKLKSGETFIERAERDKTATCVFCTKVMKKSSLTRHIKNFHKSLERKDAHNKSTESSRKPFVSNTGNLMFRKCKICMKNIKASKFDRHLKMSHSGSSDKCKLCYIRFKRKDSLRTHLKTAHPEDKDLLTKDIKRSECIFRCDFCDVKFITKSVLEYHTERKHGRGNEQCKYCSRRYLTASKLKEHIRKVHMKKNPRSLE